MVELSIGEVARRMGIATSAIRYYEDAGLIPRPVRRSGRRVYGAEILDRLALVELAKNGGFTIAEIKHLLSGFARRTPPGDRWRKLATAKLQEIDRRIAEGERMKAILQLLMRCKCPTFQDCSRAMARSHSPWRAGRGL